MSERPIDWKAVNDNLICPMCGEKAHIVPETDGTEGMHSHRFKVTRELARELSDAPRNAKILAAAKAIYIGNGEGGYDEASWNRMSKEHRAVWIRYATDAINAFEETK